MLQTGVYPASVTPFDSSGRVDMPGVARLLAWFEAAGCKGVVLAGTNGEGPSLSAVEKRDLVRDAMPMRGALQIVLGVATSSLEEAAWLCNQSHKWGATAGLVMAPSYFREATDEGIVQWFRALMDRTDLPVLVYNFPQRTGITITPSMLADLAGHPRFAGAKDSSGCKENLIGYAKVLPSEKVLYVGNETLLEDALQAGWAGTISGAANVIPYPLCCIVEDYFSGRKDSSQTKQRLAMPAIEALRSQVQPATNKALLKSIGVLQSSAVRLPLREGNDHLRKDLESHIGPLEMQRAPLA